MSGISRFARRAAAAGLLALLAATVAPGRPEPPLTLARLQRMSDPELAALFLKAEAGCPPGGRYRGRVVRRVDRPLPRVRAAATNAVWKGKDVSAEGWFVNRWAGGVRAVRSGWWLGPSLVDGRPAYVIEYPPGTPLLGGTRDELREVAPGVYLGPLYGSEPGRPVRGWVALAPDD